MQFLLDLCLELVVFAVIQKKNSWDVWWKPTELFFSTSCIFYCTIIQYTCANLGLAVTVQTSWTEDHVVTVYVGCETDTAGTARMKGYRQGWQVSDDICNTTDLLEDLLFTYSTWKSQHSIWQCFSRWRSRIKHSEVKSHSFNIQKSSHIHSTFKSQVTSFNIHKSSHFIQLSKVKSLHSTFISQVTSFNIQSKVTSFHIQKSSHFIQHSKVKSLNSTFKSQVTSFNIQMLGHFI